MHTGGVAAPQVPARSGLEIRAAGDDAIRVSAQPYSSRRLVVTWALLVMGSWVALGALIWVAALIIGRA